MKSFPQSLSDKLNKRIVENALRVLPQAIAGVDFSSNDYLGFSASHDIFKEAHQYLLDNNIITNGATGSRLITGNHDLYTRAEAIIAEFHNAESALIFNSGYDANVGLFSSILQKGDLVLYDEFAHASIRDGQRLSNAQAYKFAHNDFAALEDLLTRHRHKAAEIYIVTESVFSMDGDSPCLVTLAELSERYYCRLIIDEAHALGVSGDKGEGLIQQNNLQDKVFARVVTFGKGLGCHGAAVLGPSKLKEFLVNFARSFIYTTGLPPHSLSTILAAYRHLSTNIQCRMRLQDNISFFIAETARLDLSEYFIKSASAIHCAIVPGNENVKRVTTALQQNGFDVRAILSPTVPPGRERLRICLHSYNSASEITGVLECFMAALAQL